MIHLLEVDRELGRGLSPEAFATALRELSVSSATIEPGRWEPPKSDEQSNRDLGLLVIEGLMARDVVVADTACAELVGEGDVLRPWERLGEQAPMPYEVRWHVLEPTRVVLLDGSAIEAVCRWPELVTALFARSTARAQALAFSLAITCMTGVDMRLLVLLWHIADRWGKVRAEGVFVPLQLTHDTLGKLIGARRPSVSTALGELARDGIVDRRPGGWLLHGDPPEELRLMQERRKATF